MIKDDNATLADDNEIKYCYVSVLGLPNAGKSTLINSLIGSKVTIVTHKAQTTRDVMYGDLDIDSNTRIVFMDTPGICQARKKFEKEMIRQAWSSIGYSDIVSIIVDAKRGITDRLISILKNINTDDNSIKVILLLNKIDLISKDNLLSLSADLNKLYNFDQTFMISAIKKHGLIDIKNYFIKNAVHEEKIIFERPESEEEENEILFAEITREKIFIYLQDEIPYSIKVVTSMIENKKNSIKIEQEIYVISNAHKKIILGKNGKSIKTIGTSSRIELEKILNKKVHLFLSVTLKKDWYNT